MNMIFLLGSLILLWLHLASVSVSLSHWLPYPIARAAGVLGITLVLCALEHFVGLGRISWAWPLTTAAALGLLWLHRPEVRARLFRASELVFGVAFLYGLAWKFLLPDIYPTSERVTDLYFMQNYFPGDTLPPLDIWYPPHHFDFYYAFQHYGAALMGRLFGWQAGFTYNIAFALVMAMSLSLAWDFTSRFVPRLAPRLLLIAALALGGTGITPFLHFVVNDNPSTPVDWTANDHMWGTARFIGNYELRIRDQGTDLGRALFPPLVGTDKPAPDFEVREIPMENFGYQFYLGDYHPPLGSFFLLFLALALIGWLEAPARREEPAAPQRLAQALLAGSVPVMLITNTWIFPFSVLLLLSWIGWRYVQKRPPDWAALVAGGLISALLVYPYLSGLASQAINTPIKPVRWMDHTPLLRFVIFLWPMLILLVAALFEKKTRPLALMLVVAFGAMLLVSEFIYVQDPSGGKFIRTNTTMKWWGWMYSGAILALGTMALASPRKLTRWIAYIALALPCTYVLDTAWYLYQTGKADAGKLDGTHSYINEPATRDLVNYLRNAPRGIVLENWYGDAYTNQTLVALFSDQVSMQGWPNHVSLWHGAPRDVWMQSDKTKAFYHGEMPNALDWLALNHVRYIAWTRGETSMGMQAWQNINTAISSQYSWHPFYADAGSQVGLWIRK
ncbi:DUF2298 domain-containing protein [Silvimonas amylolytica]|uniref:Chlor_Arch_YYY domain-containing protein n=1 Tax=Silvimonas amylolytica TaxID=449663 RepID=A0ABQ2PLZ5_9NEIS|nr:DUF2298 domain-containing protein [Silvimonas amylolytica]GGP26032.1 hypothetical protein GCM10010971_18510 [Silvimonas amylolytica]